MFRRITTQKPRSLTLISSLLLILCATSLWFGVSAAPRSQNIQISQRALRQIQALMDEKELRTPEEQKMDSQLIYALKQRLRQSIAPGIDNLAVGVEVETDGNVTVDIKAQVTRQVLAKIRSLGGKIISSVDQFDAIRARMPLENLEQLAALTEVKAIGPAEQATTNGPGLSRQSQKRLTPAERNARRREVLTRMLSSAAARLRFTGAFIGSANSEGDAGHRADQVRPLGFNGAGVRIGVLSDSYNNLGGAATGVANGDLPGPGNPNGFTTAVTVVADLGSGGTDEGRAMLEIIHDLAPGAQLFFATGFGGPATMAANIITLRNTNNCNIIVDDLTYYGEGVFQDDVISQAVNTVTTAGAIYFSSAGNSGNLNDATSGVWEGDFVDGGTLALVPGGRVHDFGGGVVSNQLTQIGGGTRPVTLKWSDPLNGSNNDYDLFILDPGLTTVRASSTNTQNGTQSPFEGIANPMNMPAVFFQNDRVVILRRTGAATRALHLNTNRGQLAIGTAGQTYGHNAAGSGYSVAAVFAGTAGGGAFTGGATNPVETYSSDGPRRMFFDPAGNALTPGNVLFGTNGGQVLQKPDIAAADCVTNSFFGGGNTFCGTSAAAPHAGAIAGLLLSFNGALTPAQIRTALTSSALDIEANGVDRDSGFGIVMALQALNTLTPVADLRITKSALTSAVLTGNDVTYTISVRNLVPTVVPNVTITDNLPATTTFVSCNPTGGLVCGGSGNNRTLTLASLPANTTVTATLVAKVNCDVPNGTSISNTATVASGATEIDATNNTSSTSITAVNPPPVITCPPDIDTFTDPGQIYATINPGTATAVDAVSCPVAITGTRSDGQPLNATYPAGITTILWKATDAAGQTDTCVQTIKVRTLADLRTIIAPLIDPGRVGQFLTYRVEIFNLGPSPALGVTMKDTVATDVFFNNVTAGPGVSGCTFNPVTRVVTCDMGRIDQLSSKFAMVTVRPQFPGSTPNTATVGADPLLTLDPNLSNNTFTKYTTIK